MGQLDPLSFPSLSSPTFIPCNIPSLPFVLVFFLSFFSLLKLWSLPPHLASIYFKMLSNNEFTIIILLKLNWDIIYTMKCTYNKHVKSLKYYKQPMVAHPSFMIREVVSYVSMWIWTINLHNITIKRYSWFFRKED